MGQYYKAVNLSEKQFLSSYDYDNGAKLMEHSYIGNDFVAAVEHLLSPNGEWYKSPVVWAGDYGDDELFLDKIPKEQVRQIFKKDMNLYSYACEYFKKYEKSHEFNNELKYIVNHDKKQYVDRSQFISDLENKKSLIINPLPLLVCSGNGRGGGDYHGSDEQYVEYWAGDVISMEYDKPNGFKKIIPNFKE